MKKILLWTKASRGLFAFGLMACVFGELSWDHPLALGAVWAIATVCAVILNLPSVASWLTVCGMRTARIAIMCVVVVISGITFFRIDQLRDQFGRHFVKGYSHWRADPEVDDTGKLYYPGDNWSAPNESGQRMIKSFGWILFIAIFALPLVSWKASTRACENKRSACLFRSDGVLIETYESRW